MKQELKEHIVKHVKEFLDKELYNHRKEKEGLVSLQNSCINDLTIVLDNWTIQKEWTLLIRQK